MKILKIPIANMVMSAFQCFVWEFENIVLVVIRDLLEFFKGSVALTNGDVILCRGQRNDWSWQTLQSKIIWVESIKAGHEV